MARRLCGFLCGLWLATAVAIADEAASAPTPDPEVVQAIRALGGNVMEIAQNDPRLDVTLHLADKEITDEHLQLVARLPNVVWLNLAGTKITDAGLAAIKDLKTLEKLHLERTGIGDAGLAHLAGLEKLSYLNVYATQVTDAGLAQLAALKSLRKVYVWQSKVTDEGMAKFKELLPEATVIGELKLAPVAAPEPVKTEEKQE